jgi:hypothetical protein
MIEISVVFAIVLEHLRSSVIMEEVDPNNRQQKRKFSLSSIYLAIYYKNTVVVKVRTTYKWKSGDLKWRGGGEKKGGYAVQCSIYIIIGVVFFLFFSFIIYYPELSSPYNIPTK